VATLTAVPGSFADAGQVSIETYYLLSPATGTHFVCVTWTGDIRAGHAGAVVYDDVDQSNPFVQVNATASLVDPVVKEISLSNILITSAFFADFTVQLDVITTPPAGFDSTHWDFKNSGSPNNQKLSHIGGVDLNPPANETFTITDATANANYAAVGIEIRKAPLTETLP